jgi:flotillin
MLGYLLGLLPFLAILGVVAVVISMAFRVVVSTNDVHIVQSGRHTVSYGKDQPAGNVYYKWPSWVPMLGVKVIQLPVSVFDVQLQEYAAYDKGRVPFVVDILAFFRIEDSNVAAQRVSSFEELEAQLKGILQGASRSILAQSPIEEILEERAKYGQLFTEATNDQLKAWGVTNVKNVELMDIRDSQGSKVIQNIMAIKQSLIERDSRVNVAKNQQDAQTAEIDAQRAVLVRKQEAEETVGIRTAQKEQQIGIAGQQAQQAIKEQEKTTAEKQMMVVQVNQVRQAEIERDVQVVQADQQKQVALIGADAEKQKTITVAQGNLEQAKLSAQGTQAQGEAKGAADQAVLLAPVNAQITLAKEIGANENYQKYLISIKQVEASQAVGIEQAKALAEADIKVISNVGSPPEGLSNVMDLFSARGGVQLGAAIEAIASTPTGKAITEKLGIATNGAGSHP